ncbi:MAG: class II fructose-bisphosphate aldolase, partial [Clostridia bacterium]|nr:class II fructose-bisphosphate aldolase [Clostridia bacterium]
MLVTLKEILAVATEKNWAIGSFNTPNLENLNAVIHAAEKLNLPVIISHAQVHEPYSALRIIGPVMVETAKKSSVPVCVHLDHCESFDYMEEALKMGFTGIMYDGSVLPYEENVENT